MKLVNLKTSELIPYINNARTHDESQVKQIAASIKEFGFTNPILIDEQSGIIAGHGRLLAAELLGIEQVPTITLKGLSEAQKKAYAITDNKLALNAGWDFDLLKLEIEDLQTMDFDIDLLGFDSSELDDILSLENSEEEKYSRNIEAPVYEPGEEKPGINDLYDRQKTDELIEQINSSSLEDDEKHFLRMAAERHTIFDFSKIANYYAHSDAEAQQLIEQSALVIIDFDKAIESGFVELTKKIMDQYVNDYPQEADP